MASLLLIDDDEALLSTLAEKVRELLPTSEATVETWSPSRDDTKPFDVFASKIRGDTALVVTDWDLTERGLTGLFGPSIVDWSQARLIPVGDFSRGHAGALAKEPNLFEFRIPTEVNAAAAFIAGVGRGFITIASELSNKPELLNGRSPSAVLAGILGVSSRESHFALYGLRLGPTSGPLLGKITSINAVASAESKPDEMRSLLTYLLGHLLFNAVLRFSGPIMDSQALAAYVGVSASEIATISGLVGRANYTGPFADLGPYFWTYKVDEDLAPLIDALPADLETETQGELNRKAIELHLGQKMARHACNRCQGNNGGFYCPFTARPVCIRADCSVGSNSWIPQGATLCRIERDFYDEWSPILGF
jgi:hypothetical protein